MRTKIAPLAAFVKSTLARFGLIEADIAQLEIDVAAAGKVETVNGIAPDGAKNITLTTNNISEQTNLYYTDGRVRSSTLAGVGSNTADIVAADSTLGAWGKVRGRLATLVKDAANGIPGLDATYGVAVKNADGSITSRLRSIATAARTWSLPDKPGTLATLDDIPASNGAYVKLVDQAIPSGVTVIDYLNILTAEYPGCVIELTNYLMATGVVSFSLQLAQAGAVVASGYITPMTSDSAVTTALTSSHRLHGAAHPSVVSPGLRIRIMRGGIVAEGVYKTGGNSDQYSAASNMGGLTSNPATPTSGFRLSVSGGSFNGGTIRVYGIKA